MSTELVKTDGCNVIDLKTGETVDLVNDPTERIAELATNLAEVRAELAEVEQAVSDELVARLDRNAEWTLRVGDPTVRQWEITAKSPNAGATVYPAEDLERELAALVARGTITPDAAAKALKRQVTLVLDVPLNLPLKDTADGLSRITVSLGENEMPVAKVDWHAGPVAAGINALRKVPGTTAALDRAKVTHPVGARRAKVVLKEKL